MRTAVLALIILLIGFSAKCMAANLFIEQMAANERAKRHEVLLSHGVNTTPAAMLNLLENGFTQQAIARTLPAQPVTKSQVVNYAIQELGFQEAKTASAILGEIATGQFPTGVRSIMQRDFEMLPIQAADERREQITLLLQLNSIVALGYIGDTSASLQIEQAVTKKSLPAFVVEAALARGELGDAGGLGDLAQLIRTRPDEEMPALFEAVFMLTGRNYAVTGNTSIPRLAEAKREFLKWQEANGGDFVAFRDEILRRRATGMEIPDPPLSTLRGALRATRQFENYDRRFAAREQLQQIAAGSADELKRILLDTHEDTDIRLAAMDWYAAVQPKEARKILKDMAREDREPVLRRRAEMLILEIEELLKKSD